MNTILGRYGVVLLLAIYGVGLGCAGIRPYPRYPFRGDTRCGGRIAKCREKIEKVITAYLGTPYQWGGDSKDGLDCSGLVVVVFQQAFGIDLPHSTEGLFAMGYHVARKRWCFGDLLFFSENGKRATHVGIFVGENRFVHASEGQGVTISKFESPYFQQRYVGTRRLDL